MPEPGSDGPYYDDLYPGHAFEVPRPVTVTTGISAQYQAITGDVLPLTLDRSLSRRVTGHERALVNPTLAMHLSIGASTVASRRVLGNLFYRNVVFRRPVFEGETLRTETRVAAMSDGKPKPNAPLRGKVLLDIATTTVGPSPDFGSTPEAESASSVVTDEASAGEIVLNYQRCPLLPCRGDSLPGFSDDIGRVDPRSTDLGSEGSGSEALPTMLEPYRSAVPTGWDLTAMPLSPRWKPGQTVTDQLADVIDQAPGLVRLTNNLAATHRDERASVYGRRLVYGGHTVSLAQASLARQLPGLVTVLGWLSCDHLAPAFEGDVLEFDHRLMAESSASEIGSPAGSDGKPTTPMLRVFETTATAHRSAPISDLPTEAQVLRWRLVVLDHVVSDQVVPDNGI